MVEQRIAEVVAAQVHVARVGREYAAACDELVAARARGSGWSKHLFLVLAKQIELGAMLRAADAAGYRLAQCPDPERPAAA
jgi:hypothetical protein